ncbi:MAG: hypothetical protein R3F44_14330 [Candidatus Competibacteraceae bacterium]
MKSCRYFALPITEADDNIGVILFESEKSEAFLKKKGKIFATIALIIKAIYAVLLGMVCCMIEAR